MTNPRSKSLWQKIASRPVEELPEFDNRDFIRLIDESRENNFKPRYLPIYSPLGAAIYYGRLDVVRNILEEQEISILWRGNNQDVMAEAAYHGKLDILKYLLDKCQFKLDERLLKIALFQGHLPVAKYLAEKKSVPLHSLRQDKTVVAELSKRNHFPVLKWLVEKKEFPLDQDAFLLACEHATEEMVEWYVKDQKIAWGSNQKNVDGLFPLYSARAGNKYKSFRYLYKKQIGPSFEWVSLEQLPHELMARVCDFLPPKDIFYFVKRTSKALYKVTTNEAFTRQQWGNYFPYLKASTNRTFKQTYSDFLVTSHEWLNRDTCKKLMDACISEDLDEFINIYESLGKYKNDSICYFFLRGYPFGDSGEFVYSFLLRTKKTICLNYFAEQLLNLPRQFYNSFDIASRLGRLDLMISQLKQNPALVNEKDDTLSTALLGAARHGYANIVHYLITQKNVDLCIELRRRNDLSYDRMTPLDLAIDNRRTEVIPILLKAYAEKAPNFKHNIEDPMHYAVKNNWPDVVFTLLENDPKFLLMKESGKQDMIKTNLNFALQNHNDAVAKVLLRYLSWENKQEIYKNYSDLPSIMLQKIDNKIKSLRSSQRVLFVRYDLPMLADIKAAITKLHKEHSSDIYYIVNNILIYIADKIKKIDIKNLLNLINSIMIDSFQAAFGHTNFLSNTKQKTFEMKVAHFSAFWDDLGKEIQMNKSVLDYKI